MSGREGWTFLVMVEWVDTKEKERWKVLVLGRLKLAELEL